MPDYCFGLNVEKIRKIRNGKRHWIVDWNSDKIEKYRIVFNRKKH